jgi:hypothetical protein
MSKGIVMLCDTGMVLVSGCSNIGAGDEAGNRVHVDHKKECFRAADSVYDQLLKARQGQWSGVADSHNDVRRWRINAHCFPCEP